MHIKIPLSGPDISELEIAAVTAVLRTPRLSLGEKLVEFESQLARYADCAHGVAVSSGTAALHLALLVAGVQPGDEVIVPSFAFIAVANSVRFVGAIPVFVDIHERTLNLAPAAVQAAITSRTRAVIVVHTFGIPAAMQELLEITRRFGLRLIEDACESLGAEYHRRKVGSLGDVGTFAFYPNKQITTGEGGMLVTNDAGMAARARMLRNHGRGTSADGFDHQELGYNYRISELNCALWLAQRRRKCMPKNCAISRIWNCHRQRSLTEKLVGLSMWFASPRVLAEAELAIASPRHSRIAASAAPDILRRFIFSGPTAMFPIGARI